MKKRNNQPRIITNRCSRVARSATGKAQTLYGPRPRKVKMEAEIKLGEQNICVHCGELKQTFALDPVDKLPVCKECHTTYPPYNNAIQADTETCACGREYSAMGYCYYCEKFKSAA